MPTYPFEPTPVFVDTTNQVLSVTDLEVLRRDVAAVDAMSYRPMNTFDSSGSLDTGMTVGAYPAPPADVFLGRWFVPWQTGMTTLTLAGSSANTSTEKIYVYINGVEQVQITPASSWTQNLSISSGYTSGQILIIDLYVKGAARPASAWYVVREVYATPAPTPNWAWPSTPTFTTVFPASKLTQVGQAAQWLHERMTGVPQTARRALRYIRGPFKDPARDAAHGAYPLYYGGVLKGYSADVLRIYGTLTNYSSPDLRLKCQINGTVVLDGTTTTYGIGTHTINVPISLSSYSVGQRLWVGLYASVVNAGTSAAASRWHFATLRSEAGGSGYPYATLPAAFSTSDTPEQVRDKLNSLASILAATKTRIDGAGHVWGRVYAMRHWFGADTVNTRGTFDVRSRPLLYRQGRQIVVRGRSVSLGYGPVEIPTSDPTKPDSGFDGHKFTHTQSLIAADKIETQTIYLDTIEGLFPSTAYELVGEVEWAAEVG